jgi:hypothetical protein
MEEIPDAIGAVTPSIAPANGAVTASIAGAAAFRIGLDTALTPVEIALLATIPPIFSP